MNNLRNADRHGIIDLTNEVLYSYENDEGKTVWFTSTSGCLFDDIKMGNICEFDSDIEAINFAQDMARKQEEAE